VGIPIVIAENEVPEVELIELTIEDKIRVAFPIHQEEMLKIARCESGIKQFKVDGSVLISPTSDIGIFQINQVHWKRAKELGIDINSVDGNIQFAKLLYKSNRFGDWYMSRSCHGLI
jgi:hypothetical protein